MNKYVVVKPVRFVAIMSIVIGASIYGTGYAFCELVAYLVGK